MARKKKPAITLPGMGGMVIIETEVQAPYDPGRRERVKKAIRPKDIDWYGAQGHLKGPQERIDGTQARVEAGKRFIALYEAASGSGARSPDLSQDKVDVSFRWSGTQEAQARALRELADLTREISLPRRVFLERALISMDYTISDLGRMFNRNRNRGLSLLYRELRVSLDQVIAFYGIAQGRPVNRIMVSRETVNNLG